MSHTTASLALITFGLWEMVLLFGIVMLLFGARKLPLLARGLGSSVKNFKTELKAPPDDTESEDR